MRLEISKWNEMQKSVEMWLKAKNYDLIEKLIDSLVDDGYSESHIVSLIKTIESKLFMKIYY